MKNRTTRIITFCLALLCVTTVFGQESEEIRTFTALDSLKALNDSIVNELRNQVQELKLQGIVMQEQLEKTGKSAKEDSLRLAAMSPRALPLLSTATLFWSSMHAREACCLKHVWLL